MPTLPPETSTFIAELDAAVEAHMDWTRRILHFTVLHTFPGEDVLSPVAHTLCRFGCWFQFYREHFESLDPTAAQRIDIVHKTMHDAIRAICMAVKSGEPGQSADLEAFDQSQSELLSLLASFKTLILSNATRHDPLTGLALRHGIEDDFKLFQKNALRNNNLLFVVMIDVDHFKLINDNYGHPEGDKVLCQVANTLKANIRGNEPLYRFGGEEFLWLMQCKSREEAEQSAHRLLQAIRTTPVPLANHSTITLTATLGLALAHEENELADVVKRADTALYEGKSLGRNCCVISAD